MFIESYHFSLKSSKREEFIEITERINNFIEEANATDGFVKVFIPHTTAAVTINQNANPDVTSDLITILAEMVHHQRLLNVEGNSDAHFKSSLFGVNLEIPFTNQKLTLGPWQGIFFIEFDGPRTRNVHVQIWAL